jgi:hypothetical protein
MGKLFFCFLFVAVTPWMQAQTLGHPVVVVAPHIQAPVVIHVPRANVAHVQSLANSAEFRSLYNPLGNNPIVNPPGLTAARRPRIEPVTPVRRARLGTTVEAEDRTAVNGYTVFQVRQVQATLHRLGYYNGQVDGDFGPSTQNALERYQLSAGEPVTGTLTRGVLGRLGVTSR